VDRLPLPFLTRALGRRRGWLLLAQVCVAAGLAAMALSDPRDDLTRLALCALVVAFSAATQDIVIDAYRIESAAVRFQGAMASAYMAGYRLAMLLAQAGALAIAAMVDPSPDTYEHAPWKVAYLGMAAAMGVGILTTLLIGEPRNRVDRATAEREARGAARIERLGWLPQALRRALEWVYAAVVGPFADFIGRYRWQALLILALIATYRISDVVLGVISNVFYVDIGFSKLEVASVTKVFGVVMLIVGAALGGILVARLGVMRILFAGALLAAGTNVLFSLLAAVGPQVGMLALVIGADNLSAGLATAAFIAYLSSLTNVSYSATQYALFSSVMLLLPKFLGGFSGLAVDQIGYQAFFVGTALLGAPVLALVVLAARYAPARTDNGGD
jgi:PAT family beta-lactamase induction signal transducer AmpG